MENRTRNHSFILRLTDDEMKMLTQKVKESGLSRQAYILSAIDGSTIHSANELEALRGICRIFDDTERQLRGIATNLNQLAHVANAGGHIPTEEEIIKVAAEISDYRKENEQIWRSIRSLTTRQKRTDR